ncbi:hypothetical protein [Burkholderia ubonensis]|uniref:hypothetical protein n=1 Tax=Burkholderia ubonensis TaxID=101571 RepID=UPI0012F7A9C7|nr:hypothetical protein [Burkholderia ubonensis]
MSTDSSDGNGGPGRWRGAGACRRGKKKKLYDHTVLHLYRERQAETVRSTSFYVIGLGIRKNYAIERFFVAPCSFDEKTVRVHSPAHHVRNCHRMQIHAGENGGVRSRIASSVTTEKRICRWLDTHLYVV